MRKMASGVIALALLTSCGGQRQETPQEPTPPSCIDQTVRFVGADPDHLSLNDLLTTLRRETEGGVTRYRVNEEVTFGSYGTCRTYRYSALLDDQFAPLKITVDYSTSGSRADSGGFEVAREGNLLRVLGEQKQTRYDLDTMKATPIQRKLWAEIELDEPLALLTVRPYFLELGGRLRDNPPRFIGVTELMDLAEPRPEEAPKHERVKASVITRPSALKLEGKQTIDGVNYLRYRLDGGALWWSWFLYWIDERDHTVVRFRLGDHFFERARFEVLSLERDLNPTAYFETSWGDGQTWKDRFAFEHQEFAHRAALRLANGFHLGFATGDETVVILHHGEEGDQGTIDDEYSYSIAIVLPANGEPGAYEVAKDCMTFVAYSHTGPSAPYYLARDGKGRLTVTSSTADAIEGRLELEIEPEVEIEMGHRDEEPSTTRVKINITFKAKPK